jgi:alginate O-acetyltransferase complex protein AlgI
LATWHNANPGGLVKKFAIADVLTSLTIHLNVADIGRANRLILPVWLLAFGIKIYVDFSAYSDIAIGSARLFSIRVPENFDWPYLESNISDFWRHWHISLSTWLFDYVYIPLGGSRVRPARVYLNLVITMLLSGIWHGAAMNFLVWGLWRRYAFGASIVERLSHGFSCGTVRSLVCHLLVDTFVFVNLGWAFFCMDLKTSIFFFRRLLIG